jgi:hypothetical protein
MEWNGPRRRGGECNRRGLFGRGPGETSSAGTEPGLRPTYKRVKNGHINLDKANSGFAGQIELRHRNG